MVVPTVLHMGPTDLDGSADSPTLRFRNMFQATDSDGQRWYRPVFDAKWTVVQSGFILTRFIDARVAAPTHF